MTGAERSPVPARIRTLEEALRVLDLDLEAYGVPSSEVRARVVDDRERPSILAEYAASIVLTRRNGRLAERTPKDRMRRNASVNLWFIAWGSIVRARDGGVVVGSFSLAPRLDDAAPGSDIALGITAELLRVVRPARILAEALAY